MIIQQKIPPKKRQIKHCWQRCQHDTRALVRAHTHTQTGRHSQQLLLQKTHWNRHEQRKYYWQPWLSDSTDGAQGFSSQVLFWWRHCFSISHRWFGNKAILIRTISLEEVLTGREQILRKQIQAAVRRLLTNEVQDKHREGSVDEAARVARCARGWIWWRRLSVA